MCWVIPPNSRSATLVVRIASSSEVLPWSTWPITVTTGGRGRIWAGSDSSSSSTSPSSERTCTSKWNLSATSLAAVGSSTSLTVAITPRSTSALITSVVLWRIAAASSPTVTDSGSLISSRLISCGGSGGGGRGMPGPGMPLPPPPEPPQEIKRELIKLPESVTVGALAAEMRNKTTEVIKALVDLGVMATVNEVLDPTAAKLVADKFHFDVQVRSIEGDVLEEEESDPAQMRPRPPVVTVMGHVDHGKTSLLDAIRTTKVAEREFGGITQHIGAYQVDTSHGKVTFLDTPGHEAFTAMRARGAQATDMVVLVVAADDGVMPQTVEAINHAKAANVPILVAVNKIDKPGSDPDRVKRELSNHGLVPEDWGGQTIFIHTSAKRGDGIPQLLEMTALQAEILELRANPGRAGRGVIVEGRLDRGRGPVATALIQSGTLKEGDVVVVGSP